MFGGKRVTVGVTGGIAAYKAAELVSWLHQNGAETRVAMTPHACEFITPLTLRTLSGHEVATDIMSQDAAWRVPHIDLAGCDLLLLAPATANILAKAAHGLADDLLSAILLATKAPVLCAPAMHTDMYNHPATQENLALLRRRGWRFIEPGWGRLACGAQGQGRLADMQTIKEAVTAQLLTPALLTGKKVMVTAGPTYEYLDPVRFIGNRSSGKMGVALAEAARDAGARVTLVLGPSALADPPGLEVRRVVSAREMYDAVWRDYGDMDIVIAAAAVADYHPEQAAPQKVKKGGEQVLRLTPNPDILASLGAEKGGRFLVGFAAETQDVTAYAKQKLRQKNLDLIIANDVSAPGAGFDADTNIITAIYPAADGVQSRQWPLLSKQEAARRIIALIAELLPRPSAEGE